MRQWSTRELRYLEEHAGDGAKQVAKDLGRSIDSVKRYGAEVRTSHSASAGSAPTAANGRSDRSTGSTAGASSARRSFTWQTSPSRPTR